jgi:hypothetical protein
VPDRTLYYAEQRYISKHLDGEERER